MRKRLLLRSTQNWLGKVLALCVIGALLYAYIQKPQEWSILLFLIVTGFAVTRILIPSYLVVDYDKDFIEVKLWRLWKYDVTRLSNLKSAKAIRIEVYPGGDTPGYEYIKFLEFRNGSEIMLPETKEIEHILSRWYKKYFDVQLPIRKVKV